MYNECLIVICSKLESKEEVEKQGQSLACQFQQTMESGDAPDKEAPPATPKGKISQETCIWRKSPCWWQQKWKAVSNKVLPWPLPKDSTWTGHTIYQLWGKA